MVVVNKPLVAQKDSSKYKYWMTMGFIINRDVNINFNYTFSTGPNFYKVNYFVRSGFSQQANLTSDGYLYRALDVSIGKRFQSEWFQIAGFVGLSFIFGEKRKGNDLTAKYSTLGTQTDLQLLYRIANEVGIGIGLYGNLNFEKSYGGANINITIGNGK